MMRPWVLFFLVSVPLASHVAAQDASQPAWIETASAATAAKSGITIPLAAGTLKKTELNQFGASGIDLYAKYETSDGEIFGTIFVYAPTLPNTGLTFLATDEVVRRRWGSATHVTADTLIPVAGVRDAGRRVIYEGAEDGRLVSTAIFVRAGEWLIVDRVTGPAGRADEIKGNLDALIAGMTFPKGSEPLPAKVIKSESCAPLDRNIDAKVNKPSLGEAAAFGLISEPGIVDERGHSAVNPLREPPSGLCLESVELNGSIATQIFRAVGKSGLPYAPRLYVLYGDAGIMLEVSESQKERGTFYALRHGVGRMYAFGKFDREPSNAQIRALITRPEDQPAFAVFTSRLIQPEGHDNLNVNCDLTVEGCEKARTPTPKDQSSR